MYLSFILNVFYKSPENKKFRVFSPNEGKMCENKKCKKETVIQQAQSHTNFRQTN